MSGSIKDSVFPCKRISEVTDLVRIAVNVCRYIQSIEPVNRPSDLPYIIIHVDKMNRLFFFSDNKYWSIGLPVFIRSTNTGIKFIYKSSDITSEVWSVLAAMTHDLNQAKESDEYLNLYCRENEIGYSIDDLYDAFYKCEFGYLRYDYDIERYKSALNLGTPNKHPKCHFDINLLNGTTFKIGLHKPVSVDEFINFVDNTSDRWFTASSVIFKSKKLI